MNSADGWPSCSAATRRRFGRRWPRQGEFLEKKPMPKNVALSTRRLRAGSDGEGCAVVEGLLI